MTHAEVINTKQGRQLRVNQGGTAEYVYCTDIVNEEFTSKTDSCNIAFLTLQKNQVLRLLFYKVNQESHQPLSTDLDAGGKELSS